MIAKTHADRLCSCSLVPRPYSQHFIHRKDRLGSLGMRPGLRVQCMLKATYIAIHTHTHTHTHTCTPTRPHSHIRTHTHTHIHTHMHMHTHTLAFTHAHTHTHTHTHDIPAVSWLVLLGGSSISMVLGCFALGGLFSGSTFSSPSAGADLFRSPPSLLGGGVSDEAGAGVGAGTSFKLGCVCVCAMYTLHVAITS